MARRFVSRDEIEYGPKADKNEWTMRTKGGEVR